MDTNLLAAAVRNKAAEVRRADEERDADDNILRDAATLLRVLANVLEGMPPTKAFGPPGDWGYDTQVGQAVAAAHVATALTGGEIDTLVALVESGPLWDGDVPSKVGRDDLISRGLAVRVVVKGEDGFTAATYAGRDAYKAEFRSEATGRADTIAEAKVNRLAQRAISSMRALR